MTNRIFTTLAGTLAVLLVSTALWAHDGHGGGVGPSEIIQTLKKAHDQFHGAGGAQTARATLVALSRKLATDPTPYNKWVQQKVNAIVLTINGGSVGDAEKQLHDLIASLTRPTTALTRAALKAKCAEFHNILHAGTPDAAKRCEAAVKAYVASLKPDTSQLAVWAKRRLNDILASFAAGRVGQAETKLHTMISQL
jgi:hypothetical protein